MRILVIGYNAFDVLLPVNEISESDDKISVPEIVVGGGGPAATAAVALAKLGADVKLVTQLTSDLPGQMQASELKAAGVDLCLCQILPAGIESAKAVVLVNQEKSKRTIYWSRGNVPALDPLIVDTKWLDDIDIFYTDGHENSAVLGLAEAAIVMPTQN